jgi:hypothetical protein
VAKEGVTEADAITSESKAGGIGHSIPKGPEVGTTWSDEFGFVSFFCKGFANFYRDGNWSLLFGSLLFSSLKA